MSSAPKGDQHFDVGVRRGDQMVDSLEQGLEGRSIEQRDVIESREQHQANAGVKGVLAGFLTGSVMRKMMCIHISFFGHQASATAGALTIAGQPPSNLIN